MLFVVSSAALLILSFPRFSFWPAAWIAFLPIFYHLEQLKSRRQAFAYFYWLGVIFHLISWEWLRHVSYFGWIFLSFLYAFYYGFFGLFAFWFWKRRHIFVSLFAIPSVWVTLEWIRSEIPVWGFGWNLLAYSQAFNFTNGIASFIGAYGLSWLVMFANVSSIFLLNYILKHQKKDGFTALTGFLILGIVTGLYSGYELKGNSGLTENKTIRIGVIQGNIPQNQKWRPENKEAIIETYEKLSRFTPTKEKPDLIVWPEAAYPGFFNLDRERIRILELEKDLKVPILLGSPHLEIVRNESKQTVREIPYNSAYLVTDETNNIERYDKIRLVAFGEYVPYRFLFGPLGLERLAYSLGVSDFEPGRDVKIFSLKDFKFSVLICFEDIFSGIARRSVEKGAEFLLVITNDAWFGKSAAPYQHLDASIFRAIENNVPVIRAANTGISAFIDPEGRVLDRVKDKEGNDMFIAGGLFRSVLIGREGRTVYQKIGYQIPYYCFAFVLIGLLISRKKIND